MQGSRHIPPPSGLGTKENNACVQEEAELRVINRIMPLVPGKLGRSGEHPSSENELSSSTSDRI